MWGIKSILYYIKHFYAKFSCCVLGIVWSKQQKPIIDEIQQCMDNQVLPNSSKLRTIVKGCPGSGKTFVLLHAVHYFHKRNPTKKILFIASNQHQGLRKQTTEKLNFLGDQLIVKELIPSDLSFFDNIGLVVFDELKVQDVANKKTKEIVTRLQMHFVAATMDEKVTGDMVERKFGKDFKLYNLFGANYRSTKLTCEAVEKLQMASLDQDSASG